jgi:hypothetical protein
VILRGIFQKLVLFCDATVDINTQRSIGLALHDVGINGYITHIKKGNHV